VIRLPSPLSKIQLVGLVALIAAALPAPSTQWASVQAQSPAIAKPSNPGSEAAVRRMTKEALTWTLRYDLMTDEVAQTVKAGEPSLRQMFQDLGPLESITFVEVDPSGADVFDAKHANGLLRWTVKLTPDGKTSSVFLRRFMDLR
jgi:hypothetical protein